MTAAARDNTGLLAYYRKDPFYCELLSRVHCGIASIDRLFERLNLMDGALLSERAEEMHQELYRQGITFATYGESDTTDRVLPVDVIPRTITALEWKTLEAGCRQRVKAINLFLKDIYHAQCILKDNVLPSKLVLNNSYYRREMQNVEVPGDVYVHICGIDLIRDETGTFRVLEDNARIPSGASYVINNRRMMLRLFPDIMSLIDTESVEEYGQNLRVALSEVMPRNAKGSSIVLLSPGIYNSAYYEHIFLAQEMGVPLVEGRDLVVKDDVVYMRATSGLERVDVIYRRVDDNFLDPEVFDPASVLGVPGIMRAYREGNVTLANAIGTGVADDKAVYAYMPRIIRYYLGEDAILPNVETFLCAEKDGLQYTLDNLHNLVVKPVGESGGYGMIIGPGATQEEIEAFRKKLAANPANYISQPVVQLSVCPTLVENAIEPRHVDLRPFIVTGKRNWVLPGGLTRVALRRGSLVVNSSQGGGSKDTWVLK